MHTEGVEDTENVTETCENNGASSKIWLGQAFWMRGHIMRDIVPKPSDTDSFPMNCPIVGPGSPDRYDRITNLRHEEYGAIIQVDAYLLLDEERDSFDIELRYLNLGNNPFHTFWDQSTDFHKEPNIVMILTDGIFHAGKDSKIQDGILVVEDWYDLPDKSELDVNGITTVDKHVTLTDWEGKEYDEMRGMPCRTPVSPDDFREKIQEYGLCIIGYKTMYDKDSFGDSSDFPSGACLRIQAPEFKISRIKNWENLVLCIYIYPTYLTLQALGNLSDMSPDAIHICVPRFNDFLKKTLKRGTYIIK